MSFISIHQYFNKLQIVFLVLLMAPLLTFIVLHVLPEQDQPYAGMVYYVIIPSVAIIDWIMAIITFNKKIKSARIAQGLGAKLDKYFHITIVRYSLLASSGLILAVGFYLTGNDTFTGIYLATLFYSAFLWPTGPRVSADLRLKGDEREMVYFKRDKF